jgi:hypothetical protein
MRSISHLDFDKCGGVSQVLHQGTVRFVEVKFLFRASVTGIQEALALGSMYSLVDDGLTLGARGDVLTQYIASTLLVLGR